MEGDEAGPFSVALKPRILLMGPRRSGKSSIQRVVFYKMSPHETLFLESTNQLDIKYVANNAFVQFQIWDFPGDFDFRGDLVYGGQVISEQMIFGASSALVLVIDAQDEPYQEAVTRLVEIVRRAQAANPNISFEVFIHKVRSARRYAVLVLEAACNVSYHTQ
jgi:Ras-related GTP-binding protein C/D